MHPLTVIPSSHKSLLVLHACTHAIAHICSSHTPSYMVSHSAHSCTRIHTQSSHSRTYSCIHIHPCSLPPTLTVPAPDAGERSEPWMDSVQAGRWGGSYTLSLTLLGAPWPGHGQPWEVALPTVPHRLRQLPLARLSRSLESADSKARSGQARLVAGLVLACELFVFCLGLYRGLSSPKGPGPESCSLFLQPLRVRIEVPGSGGKATRAADGFTRVGEPANSGFLRTLRRANKATEVFLSA